MSETTRSLRLGPLLRYAGPRTATVWVEADAPGRVEVRCGDDVAGAAETWRVAGHHYALVTLDGLRPGTSTPYRVLLDGVQVWPEAASPYPASTISTPPTDGSAPLRLTFGSCRWAARPREAHHDPVGPDALDALAEDAVAGRGELPDVLVLLGDQVYADETSEALRAVLAARRNLEEPPGDQVADFEEYTALYYESWLDPEVRWLLSTVPSCMIFDDHDVIDDWNTSESWQRDMRAVPWWRERILGGLTSYWVYQHLGNLSPAELAKDPVYAAVREAGSGDGDAEQVLRDFAERADADPAAAVWSYRRDFGRVRLLMADSRAARVLPEERRTMLDEGEMAWLHAQATDRSPSEDSPDGGYDHLLIGTSLPWLLPPGIHDTEEWNAATCGGARGERWRHWGEKLRRAADLEHWAAFPRSFHDLAATIAEAGRGNGAPATVCVLSGDVHHAYVAEPHFPQRLDARVLQLTCSPIHNSVPGFMRIGFRLGWSAFGRGVGRVLARHGRLGKRAMDWRLTGGPWFGNQLMTLELHGRGARLSLDQARAPRHGQDTGTKMVRVDERRIA